MRIPISPAVKSTGCTAVRASTLCSRFSFFSGGNTPCKALTIRSFRRTLPDRYSSAVTNGKRFKSTNARGISSGFSAQFTFRKITPASSVSSSVSVLPDNSAINGISTRAFSAMDTASASLAVSTEVTATWGRIVRLVNISALRLKLPSSSRTSREHSKK